MSSRCLARRGTGFAPAPFHGRIYGDGYADNTLGPNMDPNVLSDAIPWFLAYCLTDKRTEKLQVGPKGEVLSEIAEPRDVLVFGGPLSTHILWIDAVVVVSQKVELPQTQGCFALAHGFGTFSNDLGISSDWSQFVRTRTYRANLCDSAAGRHHHRAKLASHNILVGTPWAKAEKQTPNELIDRFLRGDGFNFCPLAAAQDSTRQELATRRGLFVKKFADAE